MLIKRRSFIKVGALASAGLFTPNLFANLGSPVVKAGNKVLVVLQLSGANDGLNTVIPYRNDEYFKQRPTISISRDKALQLTDEIGLNPALTALKGLYDDGHLAILNGVGYPDNSRSHFRSMDIWESASASNQYLQTGWIGRYLDQVNKVKESTTRAIEVDDLLSLALKGDQSFGLALKDPKKFYQVTQSDYIKKLAHLKHTHEHENTVDYLYETLTRTVDSADYILDQSTIGMTKMDYPSTKIGDNFKTVASLIFSDIDTKVYYLSLGGFDTHTGQVNRQDTLFKQINAALKAFTDDLKKNNRFEDVLVMSFSEFGRRVAQNASNGTDHGAASSMFLMSGGLKTSGLINEIPSLTDLDQGDLKYSIDFKQVYATILNKWLKVDEVNILGEKYDLLPFI